MSPAQDDAIDDVPILVIGSGPCGPLLAFMLARLGVRTLVVERYPTRLDAPKAHALSPRSLELCQQFGLGVNTIRSIGANREDAYWVNFVTSLRGKLVGQLPYERMDAEALDNTPTMIHTIPQPKFESLIAQELSNKDLVEVHKNLSFHNDYALASNEHRAIQRVYTVGCAYLVGRDGAMSIVRKFLDETMVTIHINSDICPAVKGVVNETFCRKVVNAAKGTKLPYDVLSYRPWILSIKVAKAGDAAHSFPLPGGLGLNSGLGLDRLHVAIVSSEQSVKSGQQIFGLLKAVGTTDPDVNVVRQNLYRNIEDHQAMKRINEGIENQREHLDNLGLHIGYVYGDHRIPDNASIYHPRNSTAPIDTSYVTELSPEEVQMKQYSTLDLCAFGTFTLIVDYTMYENLPANVSDALKVQLMVRGLGFDL
ncbi:FAD binding domain-containing protein [Aspergillus leporis]|uniref:FAD binding domain-containing protein n=1 Tax=Aspergillus leporis TaxID=41062 RepID=A0A5N5X5D0_9EURO|nr:FAD binding domain-containing protein [Aspergillus leporis]